MKNWKRCVVYKSVNIQWGFVSTKKLTDHVTMTTVITFARPCAKGHAIIMIEIAQEKKREKTNTIILTLEFRVSNWTGPHGVTSCPIPN